MKKWLWIMMMAGLLSLCSCGQTATVDKVQEESNTEEPATVTDPEPDSAKVQVETHTEEQPIATDPEADSTDVQEDITAVASQIALIAGEKDMWLQGMEYAITDMDGNGRLELITSNCRGTGHYTYSRFYEVNETYDGLDLCETSFEEGTSQPDIMDGGGINIVCYEDAQGVRYYLFEDMLHDVADYHYTTSSLWLQDGKVTVEPLVANLNSYSTGGIYPTYIHMDAQGNIISLEEYKQIISDAFPDNYKKYMVSWTWLEKQAVEGTSGSDLEKVLLEAYEATVWNGQDALSHYGKWKIEECVGYAKVSAVSAEEAPSFTFHDVSNLEFYFSSGAGGWWTELYIHEDGSFEGTYQDSNMGMSGPHNPNGQMYYSSFWGSFTEPERVDEYIYMCRLENIEYDRCEGSEIIDGVKIDYTTAYGLDGGETFYFYLPGKKWQDLPEDFRSWVGGEFVWRYEGDLNAEDAILPFYGLFNVEEGCGFSGIIF